MINSRFGRREVVEAAAFSPEDHSEAEARVAVTEAIKWRRFMFTPLHDP
jgi:hypothetical protein